MGALTANFKPRKSIRATDWLSDTLSGLIDGAQARGNQIGITEKIRSADTEATESHRQKSAVIPRFNKELTSQAEFDQFGGF